VRSRNAAIAWVLAFLSAGPALADMSGCDESPFPAKARKALENAAMRAGADTLDLSTLHYCTVDDSALVTVDSVPKIGDGGSLRISSLICANRGRRLGDWNCSADNYQAIRLAPGDGRAEVNVRVYDGAVEWTHMRASQAFALLAGSMRVEPCTRNFTPALSIESVRAAFDRRAGPYMLYASPDGFDLVRGGFYIRFGHADGDLRVECWNEETVEE